MDRKRIIILLITISVICGGIALYLNYIEEKPPTFKTEIDRMEYVQNFQDENFPKGNQTAPIDTNTINDGGGEKVFIANKTTLARNYDIDINVYFSVINRIEKGIEKITDMSNDIKNTSDLDTYFKSSQKYINEMYGIDDLETFKKFAQKVSNLKVNKGITGLSLDESYTKKNDKVIDLKVIAISDSNVKETFFIRCVEFNNGIKGVKDSYVYWEQ